MIIRVANLDDIPFIHQVYLAAAGSDVPESNWEKLISEGGVLVAETDNDIIGFGGIDVTAVEQIKWLYVTPEIQGTGVGARILAEMEKLGWDSGHDSLRLHANPPAIEFYRRQGYEKVEAGQQIGHDHDGLEMIKYRT
ncbi:MAG TPA: GNAT family N-acetyltransferase [Pyrinomonadaceae bacterium]|nr:GNAT family N-acetyltransferase [Pyrinomonadaceae bacterium]